MNNEPALKKKLFSDVVMEERPRTSLFFSLMSNDPAKAFSFLPLIMIEPVTREIIRKN